MNNSLPQPIRRGFAGIYPGEVVNATATAPDIPANISYTVRALGVEDGGSITAANVKPTNRIVADDSMVELIPCAVGDPCVVMRYQGLTLMMQLTERFAEGECPAQA